MLFPEMSSNLHKKGSEVSTKTVFSFKGQATKHTTVKWSIASLSIFETASFAQAFNRESRVSHNSKHKTVLFDWNFMRNHKYFYLLQSFIPDLFETVYGIIKFILTPTPSTLLLHQLSLTRQQITLIKEIFIQVPTGPVYKQISRFLFRKIYLIRYNGLTPGIGTCGFSNGFR